jgi:hypothetical protein
VQNHTDSYELAQLPIGEKSYWSIVADDLSHKFALKFAPIVVPALVMYAEYTHLNAKESFIENPTRDVTVG